MTLGAAGLEAVARALAGKVRRCEERRVIDAIHPKATRTTIIAALLSARRRVRERVLDAELLGATVEAAGAGRASWAVFSSRRG